MPPLQSGGLLTAFVHTHNRVHTTVWVLSMQKLMCSQQYKLTHLSASDYNMKANNEGAAILEQILTPQEAEIVAATRIGIIGGGQLGLMTSEAARTMGYAAVTVLDPTPQSPASVVANQIVGSLKDPAALHQLAQ